MGIIRKPPASSKRSRNTARVMLLQAVTENEACDILEQNPSIKLTFSDAKIVLNKFAPRQPQPTNDSNQHDLNKMYCRILKDMFLDSLNYSQYNAEIALAELNKYYEKLGITKVEFVMSSLKGLIESDRIILDLISKHGVFEVFSIDKNTLSAQEITGIRKLVFEIAKENKNDALLLWLTKSHKGNISKEYDLITGERVKIACLYNNVTTLKTLYENNPDYFKNIPDNLSLTDFEKDFLESCVSKNFPDRLSRIKCYEAITTNSEYEDMLLSCAALKSKKPELDIVVLDGHKNLNELHKLCDLISSNIAHFNNKKVSFIMSGEHWISGAIEIKDGSVSILLVDSLGKQSIDEGANFPRNSYNPIEIFNQSFPEARFNIPENKMQHASYGCWVYAIEVARKLQKVTDLDAALPLSILRNTQSLSTIEKYTQASHYASKIDKPVNKRGLTFAQSVQENVIPDIDGKMINKRIEHKFSRLKTRVWQYLKTTSDEQLANDMHQLTLEALIKKTRLSKRAPG